MAEDGPLLPLGSRNRMVAAEPHFCRRVGHPSLKKYFSPRTNRSFIDSLRRKNLRVSNSIASFGTHQFFGWIIKGQIVTISGTQPMSKMIEPAILYAGTPVVVISTLNEDGTANLSPMSSAWWLAWSCMLGLDATSKTVENLARTGECVLNLACVDNVDQVDALAKLTGSRKLPLHKKALGYASQPDKFGASGFTPVTSETVGPPRIAECPIQMEAKVADIRAFAANDPKAGIPMTCVEVTIQKIYAAEHVTQEGYPDRIDPDKWKPLIMSFRQFYGVGDKLAPSRLAQGDEDQYAPWKKSGVGGILTRGVLKVANRKFAVTR